MNRILLFNSQLTKFLLGTTIASTTLWSINAAAEKQVIRPSLTIEVGPAVIRNPQPNFVTEKPGAEWAIPFRPTMNRAEYEAAKARANAYQYKAVPPLTEVSSPTTTPHIKLLNFDGHSSTDGAHPPDTHGAKGALYFVEVTNRHIDMYRTTPFHVTLEKSLTLAEFFGYSTEDLFDPRVVYDSTWKRWIVIAAACQESTTTQLLLIAVSKTFDPTSDFYFYTDVNVGPNGYFFDFPQLGIDQDAVLFTANIYTNASCDTEGGTFLEAEFFAVAKARLYNGLDFQVTVFGGLERTLAPPIVLDDNASTYLIAAPPYTSGGTTLHMYEATNTSHPDSTALTASTITVSPYSVPADADQPGTTAQLDTSDAKFVNASTQSGDDLWQVYTVGAGNGTWPRPRWYRFNTASGTVTQTGIMFAAAASKDFNASITANTSGDCFTTWTATNANIPTGFPSVRLSGKLNAETNIGS
jgi:hypothetical protein